MAEILLKLAMCVVKSHVRHLQEMAMTRIACFDYQHLYENNFWCVMARKICHRKKNLSTMKVVSISECQFRLTKLLHFVLIIF